MEDLRFYAWTRRQVGLAAGTLVSGLAGIVPLPGVARKQKNKKKCKKPSRRCGKSCCIKGECRFKVKGKRWVLQGNCTITRTIEIPDGVTIEGAGKTITMSGVKTGYTVAGLLAVGGEDGGRANVKNLTIDGAGLSEPCSVNVTDPLDPGGIFFGQTSGRIENVTIKNINCTGAIQSSVIDTAPEQRIDVVRARVAANPPPPRAGVGINFSGSGSGKLVANVSDSIFTSAAILFNTTVEATVDGCELSAGFIGGLHGAQVTVSNNTITDATVGVTGEANAGAETTVMTVTGNTIVGPDDDQNLLITGVDFRPGSSGSVSGNAISNYFVDGPGEGCGIHVAAGAGEVTIGANTFPPPGNEQNVCLDA